MRTQEVEIELAVPAALPPSQEMLYRNLILHALEAHHTEDLEEIADRIPLLAWQEIGSKAVLIDLICCARSNAGKFFYDLVSRALLPGRKLQVSLFCSADFFALPQQRWSWAQLCVGFDTEEDLFAARRNFSSLQAEIKLGVVSLFQASRLLEIQGLAGHEKSGMVQERLSLLVQRWPGLFDYDLFPWMQHFLISCSQEFKAVRELAHTVRMVSTLYLFCRSLRAKMEERADRRHLKLRMVRTRLHLPLGTKEVLGIFVGVNFLRENEVFEQRHVMKSIRTLLPDAQIIDGSSFVSDSRETRIQLLYLEIEGKEGQRIDQSDLEKLRRELPQDLCYRVECLTRPLFMPRNEEEVMRHIVTLSKQLRYARDLPQVVISFDQQTDNDLLFTFVLVRILTPRSTSLRELFQEGKTRYHFVAERIRKVGSVRGKHPKEAAVFSVRIPISSFLRGDYSVDLYAARQSVLQEIVGVLGEVRDYNGGMIAKEIENFRVLKEALGVWARDNELLLENFFHAISPNEMRTILPSEPLKTLFLLLLDLISDSSEGRKRTILVHSTSADAVYAVVMCEDARKRRSIELALEEEHFLAPRLITSHVHAYDLLYVGLIYFTEDPEMQASFLRIVQECC